MFERQHTFVGYFMAAWMNLIEVQAEARVCFAGTHLPCPSQQQRIARRTIKNCGGHPPEFIHVWDEYNPDALQADVTHLEDLGTYKIITLNLDGAPLKVRLAEDKPVPEGKASISFPAQWLMVSADDYLLEVLP